MKTIPAALLSAAFCLVASAEDADPLLTFFGKEQYVREFDPIHEAPVALLLDAPLRKEVLDQWRETAPQSDTGRRLKGLLLEDAADPGAEELLDQYPGDRVRLLWRAGQIDQARELWKNLEGSRFDQADAAMIPVVADGQAGEIERFREFLLEPLPGDEVASLGRSSGLPDSKRDDLSVKRKWLRMYPNLLESEMAALPPAERLAITLEVKRFNPAQFDEMRDFLMDEGRTADEREILLEGLITICRHGSAFPAITDILLCDWMEAHPDEVAGVIAEFTGKGQYRLAWEAGLPGIVHLRSLLEKEPENRTARLSLAIAQRGSLDMPEEVARTWRQCLDSAMAAPAGLPPKFENSIEMPDLTIEVATLEFATRMIPLRFRKAWFEEWQSAVSRSAGETVRMAAWLGLSEPFWAAWPEAAKDPAERRMMLECVARDRVDAKRHDQREAVKSLFATVEDEPWAAALYSPLNLASASLSLKPRKPVVKFEGPQMPYRDLQKLQFLRILMANALAVENPFRQPFDRMLDRPRSGNSEIPIEGYRALGLRDKGSLYYDGIIGTPQAVPEPSLEGSAPMIERWMARIDRSRLSKRSARSLEVMKVSALAPMDRDATEALRTQLQSWWDGDRDPEAGKMLLSYRRVRDRAQWPEWSGLWKELAAALPVQEVGPLAQRLGVAMSPEDRRALNAIAGITFDASEEAEWTKPRFQVEKDKLMPYLLAGKRAQTFLGREDAFSWWRSEDEEGRQTTLRRATAEGLAALEKTGAGEVELALASFRACLPQDRREFAQTLINNGRIDADFALTSFPGYRKQGDAKVMALCLDVLSDTKPAETLKFLSDSSTAALFAPAKVEAWTLQALDILWFNLGEREPSPLPGLVEYFVRSGSEAAALKITAAAFKSSNGEIPEMLAALPSGEKRTELMAAWLSGKPEEVCPNYRRGSHDRPDTTRLPELSSAEWREVAAMLAGQDRWEKQKDESALAILVALIAAGANDAGELRTLAGFDEETVTNLLKRAAFLRFGRDDFQTRLVEMAAGFARSIPPGDRSGKLLEMLSAYPADNTAVAASFLSHLAFFKDSPSQEVLRQCLRCAGAERALELAKRTAERRDSTQLITSRATVFREAGYLKEGWTLVEPLWPELKAKLAKSQWLVWQLLPLARAAGQEEVVRALVDSDGRDPGHGEIAESLRWLDAREGKPSDVASITGRWCRIDGGRGRLEWSLSDKWNVPISAEGELEISGRNDSAGVPLWRGEVSGSLGQMDFDIPESYGNFEARFRSTDGRILSCSQYNGMPLKLEVKESPTANQTEGPLPEMPSNAYGFSAVLGEAPASNPSSLSASMWVRGPSLKETKLVFSWLDDGGRVMQTSDAHFRCCEEGWSLVAARPNTTPSSGTPKRVRISLVREGGKPITFAGLRITTADKDKR